MNHNFAIVGLSMLERGAIICGFIWASRYFWLNCIFKNADFQIQFIQKQATWNKPELSTAVYPGFVFSLQFTSLNVSPSWHFVGISQNHKIYSFFLLIHMHRKSLYMWRQSNPKVKCRREWASSHTEQLITDMWLYSNKRNSPNSDYQLDGKGEISRAVKRDEGTMMMGWAINWNMRPIFLSSAADEMEE